MNVLLDTNIIVHREASKVVNQDIGVLFRWLDRLGHKKCTHPITIAEIRKHKDPDVVRTFNAKIQNYFELKTLAPEGVQIKQIRAKYDKDANDSNDTSLLNEVYEGRVDILITEDKNIHVKARELGIAERVFSIDDYLEKVNAENPELTEYKVLSVKKEYFGNINLSDSFFDSFKNDYAGFEAWFKKKSEEVAYVCLSENKSILAFLYLKPEGKEESYADIEPRFVSKKRLKIGTFKVISNGFKLGERFLKIIFDNAMSFGVEEIYLTIFRKTPEHRRLVDLIEYWGFKHYGTKETKSGKEEVYTRDFSKCVNSSKPSMAYPYVSRKQKKYIAPIYPEYHTELFPDSILRTESPANFEESRPNRNAIRKVFVSRFIFRNLKSGDIIVFYRTGTGTAPAHHTAVCTTIGVVESVMDNIKNEESFIALCRKRSVFSDAELSAQWKFKPAKPFIVNFMYVYTLPKRLNLAALKELKIIEKAPRGFEELSDKSFMTLMEKSDADMRFIVD